MPAPAPSAWIDATAASRLLGVSPRRVAALAAAGRITVRDLPGVRAKFWRSDVERLALGTITPARSQQETQS